MNGKRRCTELEVCEKCMCIHVRTNACEGILCQDISIYSFKHDSKLSVIFDY